MIFDFLDDVKVVITRGDLVLRKEHFIVATAKCLIAIVVRGVCLVDGGLDLLVFDGLGAKLAIHHVYCPTTMTLKELIFVKQALALVRFATSRIASRIVLFNILIAEVLFLLG